MKNRITGIMALLIAAIFLTMGCNNSLGGDPPHGDPQGTPVITINTQPAVATNVTVGNISSALTVGATATGNATTLSYQWYSNTANSNVGGTLISGATNASFNIPANLTAGTYYYYVEVNAPGGAASVWSNVATVVAAVSVLPVEMVWVYGGSFELGRELGSAGSNDVTPVSTVTLTGFYMGKYPVTQAEWQEVMTGNNNGISSNPSWFTTANDKPPAAGETQSRRPVERVSWYDAIVFCNRLSMQEGLTPAYRINGSVNPNNWGPVPTNYNATWDAVEIVSGSTGYRLPTEAQWEYAAKGGPNQALFTYAGSNTATDVAWYSVNSGSRTRAVGIKSPNDLDIYDMSGNVFEWCWDRFGNYTSNAKTDPSGTDPSDGFLVFCPIQKS